MFAFLGTADYLPCNYLLNGREINNVRFVQEAIASLLCKDWTEEDRIVIFLTEDACSRNWTDNSQIDPNGKILQREGLKSRLESLNLKAEIHPKDVPNGQSESEIWEIFDIVFNQINSDDEVIFDITHSFRSLPLLVTIILNYARILKKIKKQVADLYYSPERCRIVPELYDHGITQYREMVIAPWRIMYRVVDSKVFVLSVLDSRQNIEDILLKRLMQNII